MHQASHAPSHPYSTNLPLSEVLTGSGPADVDDTSLESWVAQQDEVADLHSWPSARGRLLRVLGWAACGLGATAGISALIALFSETLFGALGFGGASIAVAAGLLVFAVVVMFTMRLTTEDKVAAQALLWSTALVYALLMNVFSASLILGDAKLAFGSSVLIAASIFAVGGSVLLVLAVSLVVGFDHPAKTLIRWVSVSLWFLCPS